MQGLNQLKDVIYKDFSLALFFLCLTLVHQACPGASSSCTIDGTSLVVGNGERCSIGPGSHSFTEDVTVETGGVLDLESGDAGVEIQCQHFVVEPGGRVLADGVSDVIDTGQTLDGAGGKSESCINPI